MSWSAHSSPDGNEPLGDHLAEVGERSAEFAAAFGAAEWGRAAGLLHDVGKACDAFQKRLDGDEAMVDHAIGGAASAIARLPLPFGRLLAYAVAGHHGGLPDAGRLDARLAERPGHDDGAVPALPSLNRPPVDLTGAGGALFVRMVFSCLVDADFQATHAFYQPDAPPRGVAFDADALRHRLHGHLNMVMAEADATAVNSLRRSVLDRCLAMAEREPGVFSLSVPTGGGKTLASLAFALAHAKRWGKRRVVTVIPYTSIIEQTAQVYRDAVGADAVLEHHSRFRHRDDRPDLEAPDRLALRLAEENWDAPVVVTTAVQFFESLFANRPARCRKLHNLAGAVILLDEAQLMPTQLLAPTLDALRRLVEYGCTIVLCTATLPAFGDRAWMKGHALPAVTEIMEDPEALHASLRRVAYHWAGPMDDDTVAGRMLAQDQALAVVNTRAHARELFERIRHAPGAVHLSALMTPAHRSRVIEAIRASLREGRPCRVVSTQLVECGVDLDFPEVLRALAGLDSIVQSAGRCNRAGARPMGRVTVFLPTDHPTPGLWTEAASLARTVLEEEYPGDPACPDAIRWYFQRLYDRSDLDRQRILELLAPKGVANYAFRTAAEAFRLIDGGQVDVTVPVDDEARALLARIEVEGATRDLLRSLQRHTVQLRPKQAEGLPLSPIAERLLVLAPEAYDAVTGVILSVREPAP